MTEQQQSQAPAGDLLLVSLLPRFSRSVAEIAERLSGDVTSWEIAEALFATHPGYGGEPLPPPEEPAPPRRPLPEWLALVAGLFDGEAVAASPAEVIDGRLTILGLARVDEALGAALRATGIRQRLLRDLRFPVERALRSWALPSAAVEVLELWPPFPHGAELLSCVFSPDGSLLATAGADGDARLWELASGQQRTALHGHEGRVHRCEFSPDGSLLATVAADGTARLWLVDSGSLLATLSGHDGEIRQCAFSPDGALLATAGEDGTARLWDVGSGGHVETLTGHQGPLWRCTFNPDGSLLATAGEDDTARLWDVAAGAEVAVLGGHQGDVLYCAFSPDGELLATACGDAVARVWVVASAAQQDAQVLSGHGGPVWHCVFSPDGRLLATAAADGTARLWDLDTGIARAILRGHEDFVQRCSFAPGGSLLATAGGDGTARLWDVASGAQRAVLQGHAGAVRRCEFSGNGLIATASEDGTARVWEPVAPLGSLPEVAPDSVDGKDRLGVGRDAAALANVIAADSTKPPLCIGLFGDWGSGKSFLIRQVQALVRDHARRARKADRSAYCGHIRNVEFNAWHYADANLWASLVTHIFDELARPEPEVDLSGDAEVTEAARLKAQAQAARLHEQLAASSALVHQLQQAQVHVARVEALKGLLRWTWRLAGEPEGTRDLGQVRADASSVGGLARLVLPTARSRLIVAVVALAVAAAIAVPLAVFGVGAVKAFFAAAGAWLLVAGAWLGAGMARVRRLLNQVGETAKVAEVRRASIDAELAAARAREQELRQELGDLASGRRLARFAAERSEAADYRSQLGLVSRIHDDFERMTQILATQRDRAAAEADGDGGSATGGTSQTAASGDAAPSRWRRLLTRAGRLVGLGPPEEAPEAVSPADPQEAELPVIDRIVLYIDDLDRCPPRRVVEVLEAVHLILALPLFVVVVAVDPRWLLQSLRLHYAELLSAVRADARERRLAAASRNGPAEALPAGVAPASSEPAEVWESTPLHYLEKIFQIPFALRPMTRSGVESLVGALLPVEAGPPTRGPRRPAGGGESPPGERTVESAGGGSAERRAPLTSHAVPPPPPARPSLSPRSLTLTQDECDFAALAAGILDTPRAVKKFTNLYRLVRAGLDPDSGELDAFLAHEDEEIPEYQAVLILLSVIVAFPDEASDFLRSLDGRPVATERDDRSWLELVASLRAKGDGWQPLAGYLSEMTDAAHGGQTSTREPFRRWAVEVSRYSFTTGQEIFAQYHAAAARASPAPPAAGSPR